DRPDVEVVLPVLHRDVQGVPADVQVGDYRVHRLVAVLVDDVAPVSVAEQLRVVAVVLRPRALPWADAHRRFGGRGPVRLAVLGTPGLHTPRIRRCRILLLDVDTLDA